MKAQRLVVLASLLICLVAAPLADGSQDPAPPAQAQPPAAPAQPPAQPNVSVNISRTEEPMWYMNPVLIGLGVLVLVVLVVLASRGGENSTTIVKD